MDEDQKLEQLLNGFDAPAPRASLTDDIMSRLPIERPVVTAPAGRSAGGFRLFGFDIRGLAAGFAALMIGVWIGLAGSPAPSTELTDEELVLAFGDFGTGFGDFAYLEDET